MGLLEALGHGLPLAFDHVSQDLSCVYGVYNFELLSKSAPPVQQAYSPLKNIVLKTNKLIGSLGVREEDILAANICETLFMGN